MGTHRPHTRVRALVVALLAVALVACGGGDDDSSAGGDGTTTTTVTTVASDAAGSSAPASDASIPDLVREVEPSVVAVLVRTADGRAGEGSGVIVREDGVIVTNNHVVGEADALQVVLADGSRLDATVEATDPFTDLAIIRVDRQDLPAIELADGYPTIGQLAVAVGNPLGFENTVTAGIISGIGRSIPASSAQGGQSLVDLVQTDAAISPGNSGGALIGPDGRLTGINVAYIPPASGAVSLGFAIPAPTVADVVDELLQDGRAEHAYVGVQLATVSPQIAEQYGLGVDAGAAVVSVEAGTPAALAGLEQGDVITAVDGDEVREVAQFLTLLRRYDPGDRAELTVTRGSEERSVDIVFGDRPTD